MAGGEEKVTQSAPQPILAEVGPAKNIIQPIVVDTSGLALQEMCHCKDVRHAHPVDWKKARSAEAGSGSGEGSGNPNAARRVKAKLARMPKLMARCLKYTPDCAKLGHFHIPWKEMQKLEEEEIQRRAQDMWLGGDENDDYYEDVPIDADNQPKLIIISSAAENAAAVQVTEMKDEGKEVEVVASQGVKAPPSGPVEKPSQNAAESQTPESWEAWAEVECDVASWMGPSAPPEELKLEEAEVGDAPHGVLPEFGPSLEGRHLEKSWVTLYLTASPARGELSFTQWLLQKLPLIRQSDAVSYQVLREELCLEAEEVDSLLTQHYSAGWSWMHTDTFHVSNQHSSIYWLAKTYNSVKKGQIYEAMYESLSKVQEWDTSMQFSESGLQPTALSFFSSVLDHHFRAMHTEWKRDEKVYNNTLGYCANRYVAIFGARLAYQGKGGVTFPFAGALGATSLNVSRSGGSR